MASFSASEDEEYDPDTTVSIARSVGKCPNCSNVIEQEYLMNYGKTTGFGYQLYAVAYKKGKGSLEFRVPNNLDLGGVARAEAKLQEILETSSNHILPDEEILTGFNTDQLLRYGIDRWSKLFNPRQLLTLVTYVDIIQQAKAKIRAELGNDELDRANAVITYLALVLDRCVDKNCRLAHWDSGRSYAQSASSQHSLNLMWSYPETTGGSHLWNFCADVFVSDYETLCTYLNASSNATIPGFTTPASLLTHYLKSPNPPPTASSTSPTTPSMPSSPIHLTMAPSNMPNYPTSSMSG